MRVKEISLHAPSQFSTHAQSLGRSLHLESSIIDPRYVLQLRVVCLHSRPILGERLRRGKSCDTIILFRETKENFCAQTITKGKVPEHHHFAFVAEKWFHRWVPVIHIKGAHHGANF